MKHSWLGLPDIEDTPVRVWRDIEKEQTDNMRALVGDPLWEMLMNLDPDEKYFTEKKCKPIWPWPQVSRCVGWVGDKPVWETPGVDEYVTDYTHQRAAAIAYLDRRTDKEEVHKMAIPDIFPIAVLLALVALIGLTLGWTFR